MFSFLSLRCSLGLSYLGCKKNFFSSLVRMCVWYDPWGMHDTAHAWKTDNFMELVLSFQLYMSSRNQIQVARLYTERKLHMKLSWRPSVSVLMGSCVEFSETHCPCKRRVSSTEPSFLPFLVTLPFCALSESLQLSDCARTVSPDRWETGHKLPPCSRHCPKAAEGQTCKRAHHLPDKHRQVSSSSRLTSLLLEHSPPLTQGLP